LPDSIMLLRCSMKVSIALRIYLKGNLGTSELTSEEILRTIKGSKYLNYIEDVKQCFMLCDPVKFAKYETNMEDFNKAVEYAKRVLMNESS